MDEDMCICGHERSEHSRSGECQWKYEDGSFCHCAAFELAEDEEE